MSAPAAAGWIWAAGALAIWIWTGINMLREPAGERSSLFASVCFGAGLTWPIVFVGLGLAWAATRPLRRRWPFNGA